MKNILGVIVVSLIFCMVESGWAAEMRIRLGESVRVGDTTVMCDDRSVGNAPVIISDCQYWDKYDKRCLFEKRTVSAGGIECVEECQHWDAYEKNCEYPTKCTNYPDQNLFVRTTCELFDPYEHVCRKIKETRINDKSPRN
ncbi:MAG: hypothetical protein A2511_06100 [Deltaproteobacteria bacterium RIFOXYD12_FULL_50_9]|nr:MAG: hypothetical protein A2511_06100 [Deltaproteobacteria bacterium RIFOXYD12_FULL_50_9]